MAEDNDINKNKEQDWYKALSPEQQKQIDSYWANQEYTNIDTPGGQALINNTKGAAPTPFVVDNGDGKPQMWTPAAGGGYTPSLYQAITAQSGGGGSAQAKPSAPIQAAPYNPEQNMGPLPATNAPVAPQAAPDGANPAQSPDAVQHVPTPPPSTAGYYNPANFLPPNPFKPGWWNQPVAGGGEHSKNKGALPNGSIAQPGYTKQLPPTPQQQPVGGTYSSLPGPAQKSYAQQLLESLRNSQLLKNIGGSGGM